MTAEDTKKSHTTGKKLPGILNACTQNSCNVTVSLGESNQELSPDSGEEWHKCEWKEGIVGGQC